MVLPTLAPYPVDYPSTSTYYWPNIIENVTQVCSTAVTAASMLSAHYSDL